MITVILAVLHKCQLKAHLCGKGVKESTAPERMTDLLQELVIGEGGRGGGGRGGGEGGKGSEQKILEIFTVRRAKTV